MMYLKCDGLTDFPTDIKKYKKSKIYGLAFSSCLIVVEQRLRKEKEVINLRNCKCSY